MSTLTQDPRTRRFVHPREDTTSSVLAWVTHACGHRRWHPAHGTRTDIERRAGQIAQQPCRACAAGPEPAGPPPPEPAA